MLNERSRYAMARLIAKAEVTAEIRRRGEKPSHYSARALSELTDSYIRDHREEIGREITMQ